MKTKKVKKIATSLIILLVIIIGGAFIYLHQNVYSASALALKRINQLPI